MSKELKKRIITSVLLIFLVILCINKILFSFISFAVFIHCYREWINMNTPYFFIKRKESSFFAIQFLGFIYLFIFWLSSLIIYDYFGPIFFIFILFICAFSDVGGYFFGKMIGGIKLTKISPKKTVAGSVGSFIFSIIPLILFNYQNYIDVKFTLTNILVCLIISLSCQIGDLIISYFKRLNKIKDTGNILPGHGGILDRIDGIIFAIPVVYMLKIMQIF